MIPNHFSTHHEHSNHRDLHFQPDAGRNEKERVKEQYVARPLEGRGRRAEEAVGVEEGADAAERDADSDRHRDPRPMRQGFPAAAAP